MLAFHTGAVQKHLGQIQGLLQIQDLFAILRRCCLCMSLDRDLL